MSINWFKQKIGFRLSIYAVLIAIFFAIISSILILSFEYYKNRNQTIVSANHLMQAITPQLAKALWNIDDETISITLDSIKKYNFIKDVQLSQ